MGYVINVKNAKFAHVTSDTASDYAIAAATPLPGLQSIDLTLTSATGELYGDGAKVSQTSKVTGAQVKIALAKLTTAERAGLTGASISSDGVLSVKTTDVIPKIALYVETEQDDGNKEQLWFLCGRTQPAGKSATQSTSSINYSTDEMTIDFMRREKDKTVYQLVDTSDTSVTSQKSTSFEAQPD